MLCHWLEWLTPLPSSGTENRYLDPIFYHSMYPTFTRTCDAKKWKNGWLGLRRLDDKITFVILSTTSGHRKAARNGWPGLEGGRPRVLGCIQLCAQC